MNLLHETELVLQEHNKSLNDVVWIGCKDFKISLEQFKTLANIDYDNGHGARAVAEDLLVVGKDWWLERGEYDGAEWWEFKQKPLEPDQTKNITAIMEVQCIPWESAEAGLSQMNGIKVETS